MSYALFAVARRVLSPLEAREDVMKVGSAARKEPVKPSESGAFKKVFEQVRRSALAGGARVNPATRTPQTQVAERTATRTSLFAARALRVAGTAAAPGEKLSAARHAMNTEVARLGSVRTEALVDHRERLDARLIDIICRELTIEFSAGGRAAGQTPAFHGTADASPPPTAQAVSPVQAPAAGAQSQTQPPVPIESAEARAASAIELIEKIETFVRSQRPALAMTLAGGLGARVEIERLGPKEVAIKVQGKRGPPSPEEVTQIREEIRAKGLRLSALSVS